MYTYKKLQKDKSPWYCICCLQKELPHCSIGNVLNSFMHGNRILSPDLKFIPCVIKQSEYFDEELLGGRGGERGEKGKFLKFSLGENCWR